jgi:CHAT domain-containing protein
MSNAAALRAAKRWLCEAPGGNGARPCANPFFGTGFILIGVCASELG